MFISVATVSFALSLGSLGSLVAAAPTGLQRRQNAGDPNVLVLQFADVLEQLESTFYSQALTKFQEPSFLAAGYGSALLPIQQIQQIQSDEAIHDTVLQTTLQSKSVQPVSGCTFDFGTALDNVQNMASTARVIENTGVAAYLGGAALITDPGVLEAAASILTVEARHQTILNVLNQGVAIPSAFDIPLAPNEVLAIASGFIKGCSLPIQANAPLSISNSGAVGPGTLLKFNLPSGAPSSGLFCQMITGGATAPQVFPVESCSVPDNLEGPVAVFVTANNTPLPMSVTDRSKVQVVAGPLMAFIDFKKEALGTLVKTPLSALASFATQSGAAAATASASSSNGAPAAQITATVFMGTGNSPDNAMSVMGASSVTPSPVPTSTASATTSASSSSATDSSSASATGSAISVIGTSSVTPSPTASATASATDSASSSASTTASTTDSASSSSATDSSSSSASATSTSDSASASATQSSS